jgi:hypothetical protein
MGGGSPYSARWIRVVRVGVVNWAGDSREGKQGAGVGLTPKP